MTLQHWCPGKKAYYITNHELRVGAKRIEKKLYSKLYSTVISEREKHLYCLKS